MNRLENLLKRNGINKSKVKDIFYKEPLKLALKDVEVNVDSIYGNYIPRHYMVRQWDKRKEWAGMVFPFDLTKEGKFLSVCLRDKETYDFIIYDTFKEMFEDYKKKNSYEYIIDEDIIIVSDEPLYKES